MSERILVVDDEDTLRVSMKMRLQTSGFEVDAASDGEEALEKLKQRDFDIVLLDVKMPRLNGTDALPLILESRPQADVIMMTGFADFSSAIDCLKAGAKDYLVKPIDATELVTRIKALLRTRASEKAVHEVQQQYSSMMLYNMYGTVHTINQVIEEALKFSKPKSSKDHTKLLNYARELSSQMAQEIRSKAKPSIGDEVVLEPKKTEMEELVKEVCAHQAILARQYDVTLKKVIDASLPSIQCDTKKIEQVVTYVVNAAIRNATKGAKVTVSLSRASGAPKRDFMLFSIDSSSSRIQAQDLDVLFNAAATSEEKFNDTLFHLAIAKRIIEAHGGSFHVASRNGRGIKYDFTLPLG